MMASADDPRREPADDPRPEPDPLRSEPADSRRREPAHPLPGWLLGVGYLVFALAGVLTAVLTVTLIPLRYGATLVPIAPLLILIAGIALPLTSRALTDTRASSLPPVIGQILTLWLLSTGRPEGDVLMPAGDTAWIAYAVLILGTVVPLAVVGFATRPGPISAGDLRRRRRPVAGGSGSGGVR